MKTPHDAPLVPLEITWQIATHIWWAFVWRNLAAVAMSSVVSFAIGFAIAWLIRALGAPETWLHPLVAVIAFAIGLLASVVAMRLALTKSFRHFGISVLPRETSEREHAASEGEAP